MPTVAQHASTAIRNMRRLDECPHTDDPSETESSILSLPGCHGYENSSQPPRHHRGSARRLKWCLGSHSCCCPCCFCSSSFFCSFFGVCLFFSRSGFCFF